MPRRVFNFTWLDLKDDGQALCAKTKIIKRIKPLPNSKPKEWQGQFKLLKLLGGYMALGKHTRNVSGRIRKERSDSLVKNLKKEYPEFENINGNKKLGTLEKKLGVDSLSQVRKALKNKDF